jgi:acyl carrier protein
MTAEIRAIKDIIEKLKRAPGLAAELRDTTDILDGVGLDSLELLQFMLELEERLAIQIDFDKLEYSYLHSIQTLAEFLETMPSRRAPASLA